MIEGDGAFPVGFGAPGRQVDAVKEMERAKTLLGTERGDGIFRRSGFSGHNRSVEHISLGEMLEFSRKGTQRTQNRKGLFFFLFSLCSLRSFVANVRMIVFQRMTTLEEIIRAEIRATGPMRFDRFMEMALYHPGSGYYAKTGGPSPI